MDGCVCVSPREPCVLDAARGFIHRSAQRDCMKKGRRVVVRYSNRYEKKPYPTDLSDDEWTYIEPHMPAPKEHGRPRLHSTREILDAIFF